MAINLVKYMFVCVLGIAVGYGAVLSIRYFDVDYELNTVNLSEVNAQVVLLATSWCEYCEKARQLLRKNNVKFTEFDVEKSAEGRRLMEATHSQGVPVILIENRKYTGFNERAIVSGLQAYNLM